MKTQTETEQHEQPWWCERLRQWLTRWDLGRMLQYLGEDVAALRSEVGSLHRAVIAIARAETRRDFKEMAKIEDVIAKATEAKTVSESTNIAVREVIRLLKESGGDPAKFDEAIALLEAMRANDAAMLTENTPAAE